ncbi:NADP-dependent oxidoreductase [Nocardia otitidiscaviarum]|uniref:NADP-dependent oxidoreductase n=1 Tax=Nocardia otitidiscaviarum TaxID=1823 RepID=UPI0004A6C843|nr:NADP-dependent oxidoreductase [Nocardia otitidiscaviarum]MBF6135653.1 NADP-dependent oxidoreductase [Nocardia otitidiscaviarum]MBF6487471.1 NADP-dependent oxidoreductase [Nocardia otitidiscaviarum]
MTRSREWRLIARPQGEPTLRDFELADVTLDEPGPGQILVANEWLSVDPYMRGRMNAGRSYMPPFELGRAMSGGAVGTVTASRAASIPVGASVIHFAGWREYAVLDAVDAQPVDTRRSPAQAYLGVLGATGLTAYVGLTDIAGVRAGDTVFVSAAAGAVGSVAGQIARNLGAARVIGSAGGADKCARLLDDFGFDAAIDYRGGDLAAQLAAAAPEGIDVYFDNVGGEHLQAALTVLNDFGRVALCGAVSVYNDTDPAPGPSNLHLATRKRITLRGFLLGDHTARAGEWVRTAAGWLTDGTLRAEETVVEGIDHAVDAFLDMMRGGNTGKMLVRLPRA